MKKLIMFILLAWLLTVNTFSQTPEKLLKKGYNPLFDGTSLAGWTNYKKQTLSNKWTIEDGALKLTEKGGGDMIYNEVYQDFDLCFEWKISEKGNSGVFYFIQDDSAQKAIYHSAPEYQILDNAGHPDGKLKTHRAASLYDLIACPDGIVKPANEWNNSRIVFRKGKLTHWLNGKKAVSVNLKKPAFKEMVAKSKFKQWSQFATKTYGKIGLQDHGDVVWYRNIYVKKL